MIIRNKYKILQMIGSGITTQAQEESQDVLKHTLIQKIHIINQNLSVEVIDM